ncbi:MAG: diguanylate cyclase [Lysobacterales bacterium]
MLLRSVFFLFGLGFCALAGAAEQGVLPAKTWDVRELQADQAFPDPPFYSLVQTKEGLIYVGDNSGLLEFDGRRWRRLPLDSPGAVTVLGAPRSGGLVVGGPEFLRFFPQMSTPLRALDPALEIPDGLRGSGEFWEFAEDPNQWCLRSDFLLVCAADGKFRGFRSRTSFGRLFQGQDAIYVKVRHVGLSRVGLDGPELIAGGEVFAEIDISTLVESHDQRITAITERPVGLWEWHRGSPPARNPAASLHGVVFPIGTGLSPLPGRLVLPEQTGGVAIVDAEGVVQERIEPEDMGVAPGLQSTMVDREGGLWLAWRSALSRIEYPSRIALFPMPEAAYGESLSVTRTSFGITTWRGADLFVLAPQAHAARWTLQQKAIGTPVILKVISAQGVDYAATVRGLWPLSDGSPALPTEHVLDIAEVSGDPERIWAGLRKGIALLHRNAKGWEEALRQEVSFDVVSIQQSDPRTLWLGSLVGRVARLNLGAAGDLRVVGVVEFGPEAGLPKGTISVEKLDDRVLFLVKGGGFLEFRDGQFAPSAVVPLTETGALLDAKFIDATQLLVANASGSIRLLKRDVAGVFRAQRSIFDDITGIGVSRSILVDPDGVVWLAADAGVVRVDPRIEVPSSQPQQVLIREVSSDKQPLFDGAGAVPALTLKAGANLRFGYALPSYRAAGMNRYRSRIRPEPGDAAWSPWSGETQRDFTNLAAGVFRFEVEALDATGVSGGIASVPLTVVAPWYRRAWAVLAFWLLGLSLVGVGVQWRLRALHERSAELERLVAAKTVALRIAATTDPLTGLCNRHRFGEWMRDEVAAIQARASTAREADAVDLFVAAIDLDHFKLVNDQHGHAAGDAVLKAVASRLRAFKREEDLIFRFGGEEFVYLGLHCHRDDGKAFAEQIIAAIAELNVELDSGVLIQPTASLGWSVYPFYRERPELFSLDFVITIADRALYLAKQEGRNRACGHLPNLPVDSLDRTQADWRSQVFSRHPDFLKRV